MADLNEVLPTQTDLSLLHLQAELARIDLLIRREVRRWWLAGQDPNDDYRGMYIARGEVERLLEQAFGTSWGQTISLEPAEAEAFAEALAETNRQAQRVVEAMEKQGQTPRLRQLAHNFKLDQTELDILLICLAPAFDPRYDRLYGYLQDNANRRRPMVRLVLALLGQAGPGQFSLSTYFDPASPLLKYELLTLIAEPGAANTHWINQTLQPDDTVVAWLMGRYQPPAALGEYARRQAVQVTDTDRLLTAEMWPRLARALEDQLLVAGYGPDQAGQQAMAHRLAAEKGVSLLTVDLVGVIQGGLSPLRAVRLALRDARLTGALPYLTGWERCLAAETGSPPPEIITELYAYPGLLIVAGETAWQPHAVGRWRPMLRCEFPRPTYPQRLALWQHFLDGAPAAADLDATAAASRFLLTSGQIRDAVALARDMAFERGEPLQNYDLFAAARSHSSPRLSGLARKITTRYTWPDLILPTDQVATLQEIVATVRQRPLVLEGWGVGRKLAASAGVAVLFAGPPGTGKTMAAEVMAGELGLDLYKIDLSNVISKYIGETEKNLERIFHEAENSNAILFFDEADALFGKRSEVRDSHDRYANIEISYLLQRMESYNGLTILATNLGSNIDEAFTRRLQFVVEFPFPTPADQRLIWQILLPSTVPTHPDLDFDLLAERFDLAGGNIRNILLNAAYFAAADGGQVTMAHLLHSTRRELQKMGRLLDEEELKIS